MTLRIAISGTGRIGRLCIRAPFETGRTDIEIVAINSRGKLDALVHLLKYDSVHGRFGGTITHVITHNMHHRGEVLHMLSRLGLTDLPEGDLLSWEAGYIAEKGVMTQ